MLSIAILDDNLKLLEEYKQLIPTWFDKNNIKGQIVTATADYKEFLQNVRDQSANVCILDINLRTEINGLFIAKFLRKEGIPIEIIFCTGFLEYMPLAFDVNAYHFIMKPVGHNLEKCLIKLSKEIEAKELSQRIIEIKYGSHIYYVPISSITHFQRKGSKTIITTTSRMLEVYDSLEAFNTRLNDYRFVQCHRSTIINRDFIDYIDIKGKSITLTTGIKCELGSKFNMSFSRGGNESYAV
jgi:DNA-binding LytR/AlgR family response regulator